MDDDDDPITGEFPTDSTWALPVNLTFFDSRHNNILSELGWNFHPTPPELDQIDSSNRCEVLENTNPTTSSVSDHVQSHSRSVENAGDVSISNPLASSTSSDDRPEFSAVTIGKPPLSDAGGKVKKKGPKRIRQQRFAFMTKTEIDHLEDGYRWRKYGQKAVKNSPFPRSYYRCTNNKCTVKKRVERSSTDPTTVITTYEGQHCHHIVGYSDPSSTSQQFIFPRTRSPNQGPSLSQTQVSSEPSDHLSHENPPTQASFQESTRVDQGLLGDIVPPIMRN